VGSDDEEPAARRELAKVAALSPRRTRQTAGKIPASKAVVMIAATQAAESKKKRKRVGPAVSADTSTTGTDVEMIGIEEDDDAKSPNASIEQAAQTPRKITGGGEHPRSGADVLGDAGWQKRAKNAPPKPIKLALRSTGK
jgi:hypothetical protein